MSFRIVSLPIRQAWYSFLYLHTIYQSKTFSSAHQVMGFIVILIYFLQLPVRCVLHRRSKRNEPTRNVYFTYVGIAILIFILAIINGGLGFRLALDSKYNKVWIPLSTVILVICLLAIAVKWAWDRVMSRRRFGRTEHGAKNPVDSQMQDG
jgi:L-asparagine transporter-like permease